MANETSWRLVRTFEYKFRFIAAALNRKRGAELWKATPGRAPRKRHTLKTRSNAEPVE
jgi:hypothetical protein